MKLATGCKRYNDCLTCPFKSCPYDKEQRKRGQLSIDWNDRKQVRAYKRQYARESRKRELQAEFPFINFEG